MTGYPNPLLPGFHPDPSIVEVDGVYYLVTSTFEYLPGLPVYRSTNFLDWSLVGHVISRESQVGRTVPTNAGIWAPTIRHHDGMFHVVVTDVLGRGCLHFSAERADGPWSEGTVLDVQGIDPDLIWDDGGAAVLTYSALSLTRPHEGIWQVRVDLATGQRLEEPRSMWSGTGLKFPEAPHLYRRDGWWYLLIAEGGTERGHSVSVARSRSVEGPWEPAPHNPVLTHAGTDRAVQCTGHGDLVVGPDGGWLLVLLGTRPRSMTNAFSALGRETFVTTVAWESGWPVVQPVPLEPRDRLTYEDQFDGLAPEWIGVRRLPSGFANPGGGRLELVDGRPLTDQEPVILARRQQHQTCTVSVRIDTSQGEGGLVVRCSEDSWYAVLAGRGRARAVGHLRGLEQQWTHDLTAPDVELTLTCRRPAAADVIEVTSDEVDLSVTQDGRTTLLATLDGRYLSSEVTESFTGRVIGIACTEGSVAVDWFRYDGSDD